MYTYKNGNYIVSIKDDGTKIRESSEDAFIPEFPESCDVKITNYCDLNNICVYCHEQSNKEGIHGDLAKVLDAWSNMPNGVELAIGGGNPMSHPEIENFVKELSGKNLIPNITVNQLHLSKYRHNIYKLIRNNSIFGLGISYRDNDKNILKEFLGYENSVLHIIAGASNVESVLKLIKEIEKPKILILGYKKHGNGISFFEKHKNYVDFGIKTWYNKIPLIIDQIVNKNGTVSFDNLAIEQLGIKRLFKNKNEWKLFYQGDDGKFTFYLDAVKEEFAISSTSKNRYKSLNLNSQEMFKFLQNI